MQPNIASQKYTKKTPTILAITIQKGIKNYFKRSNTNQKYA